MKPLDAPSALTQTIQVVPCPRHAGTCLRDDRPTLVSADGLPPLCFPRTWRQPERTHLRRDEATRP